MIGWLMNFKQSVLVSVVSYLKPVFSLKMMLLTLYSPMVISVEFLFVISTLSQSERSRE